MKPGAIFAEHYRVLSQLGVGGMGEVYLVENIRLGRREALKLLHTTGDDEAVARFEREARTAARLGHPSIADIYHYGTTDSGRPWFTMVYVEGTDLTKATLTDAEGYVDYSYINHLVVNGGVIACGFGDVRDGDAAAILAEQYPGRRVVTIDARPLFERGGGIHCITQQQPAPRV